MQIRPVKNSLQKKISCLLVTALIEISLRTRDSERTWLWKDVAVMIQLRWVRPLTDIHLRWSSSSIKSLTDTQRTISLPVFLFFSHSLFKMGSFTAYCIIISPLGEVLPGSYFPLCGVPLNEHSDKWGRSLEKIISHHFLSFWDFWQDLI